MAKSETVKVQHQCAVSPPEGSVPTTRLPLSFFDLPWLASPPMQRLVFYDFPHATDHFMSSVLPSLKRSLSLSLQLFFPFAGNLICPPQPQPPYILYTTQDSISLTIAESNASNYNHLVSNNLKHSVDFHPFVPEIPQARVLSDETREVPLLAVQITVFPNEGLAVGVTFRHVAADGMALHHFLKSWASICRTGSGDPVCFDVPQPFHDRAGVPDLNALKSVMLTAVQSWASFWNPETNKGRFADKVRATFVLSKTQVDGLKRCVSKQEDLEPILHKSTFVVASSLTWVCLVKSQENGSSDCPGKADDFHHFIFFVDCRSRLEQPLPPTYFGNCLGMFVVSLKKKDLLEESGITVAANAIAKKVGEILDNGVLKNAEKWLSDVSQVVGTGNSVSVAGSPRFSVYDTDFGWGRPKKTEVVHIGASGGFSLDQSRNEKGGIEVGIALTTAHMNRFTAIWEQSLKLFSS